MLSQRGTQRTGEFERTGDELQDEGEFFERE
jgi:hypothetical protein